MEQKDLGLTLDLSYGVRANCARVENVEMSCRRQFSFWGGVRKNGSGEKHERERAPTDRGFSYRGCMMTTSLIAT